MVAKPEKSVFAQRSLLGAILFVFFLASLGGAWWLSSTRTALADNGASLLKEIRSSKDGLRHYWGEQTVADFYVIRDERQKAVAWSASIRIPLSDGYQIVNFQPTTGPQHRIEIWSLLNNLGEGSLYDPHELRLTFNGSRIAAKNLNATAEMPANYLPDALLPLAAELLAGKKSGASFKTIDSANPVSNGQFNFNVSYLEPQSASVVRVKIDSVTAGSETVLYEFDGNNTLRKIQKNKDGRTYELTPAGKTAELFPKDALLRELTQAAESLPADDRPIRQILLPHPATRIPQ